MIALEADLQAQIAGVRMRVVGLGNVLICRLDGDPPNVVDMLRSSRQLLLALRALTPLLVRTGIRLDVMAGSMRIGRAGSGVEQNTVARMFGLPSVHLGA